MKLLSETYKELGIDFSFPIEINDANGKMAYYEDSDGIWARTERDANGNPTYYEDSDGDWYKYERDVNGKVTYYEDSKGVKQGTPRSAKTCEGKVVEVDVLTYDYYAASYDDDVNMNAVDILKMLGVRYKHTYDNGASNQTWFWVCKGIPVNLPKYFSRRSENPMGMIGWGLTEEKAIELCDDRPTEDFRTNNTPMKLLSETYKELGIAFTFPIIIKGAKGNETYCEDSEGSWGKWEYDVHGNLTYYEDIDGWSKWEFDAKGNETYWEDSDDNWVRTERDANGNETCRETKNSDDYWSKWERDSKGNETYYENSDGLKEGTPRSAKTCEGKVVEMDGIKYQLKAL